VRAALHRELIKTGLLYISLERFYDKIFESRHKGDYHPMVGFESKQVKEYIIHAMDTSPERIHKIAIYGLVYSMPKLLAKFLDHSPDFRLNFISLYLNSFNLYERIHPACPARPVSPGDCTGVRKNYRTGVESVYYSGAEHISLG